MVVEQLGGSILEGFGQSSQQHGELWGVELKQGNQHHLGCLKVLEDDGLRMEDKTGKKMASMVSGLHATISHNFTVVIWCTCIHLNSRNHVAKYC